MKNDMATLGKSKVLSKIQIIGWRLTLNSLSTRAELVRPGIIEVAYNSVCPLCFDGIEDMEHLFYTFDVASSVRK